MRLIIILFIFISSNIYAAEEMKNLKIYLTSLKSISIDFSQIDNSGKLINGKLLIQKPYNFRCNYYEPFPLLIVGNKTDIIIYDYEMEQTSYISASENIFNFLLVDTENFEEYFSLIEII
jgi:outer membrane lipoprotein-sorting protein